MVAAGAIITEPAARAALEAAETAAQQTPATSAPPSTAHPGRRSRRMTTPTGPTADGAALLASSTKP